MICESKRQELILGKETTEKGKFLISETRDPQQKKINRKARRSPWSRGKECARRPGGLRFESRLSQIVYQNVTLFAKSEAAFNILRQREGVSKGCQF